MTLLIGVILILGVLSWRLDSSWEWEIPHKWQVSIESWRDGFSSRTQSLTYDWYLGPENRELEKHLWHLKKAFPGLSKQVKAPIRVLVWVYPNFSPDQNERYIACLQRRFPELKIYGGTRGQVDGSDLAGEDKQSTQE